MIAAVLAATLAACAGPSKKPPTPTPPSGVGSSPAPAPRRPLPVGSDLSVDRERREVVVDAEVACNRGWLEQAACRAGTREHESLLAIQNPPATIHACLLLAGAEPGAPGSWKQGADGTSVVRVPPTGSRLELFVRLPSGDVPISEWIHDPVGGRVFPVQPWVFAGSQMRPNTPSMGPGKHYVADRTGSIVGIVTFGDEMIACDEVISDKAEVDAPQWQARTERMPEPGTRVKLVIRVAGDPPAGAAPAAAKAPAP
ncbi:MAG: YdjY domain-containing protein [Phycisphaerales bacterium]